MGKLTTEKKESEIKETWYELVLGHCSKEGLITEKKVNKRQGTWELGMNWFQVNALWED